MGDHDPITDCEGVKYWIYSPEHDRRNGAFAPA